MFIITKYLLKRDFRKQVLPPQRFSGWCTMKRIDNRLAFCASFVSHVQRHTLLHVACASETHRSQESWQGTFLSHSVSAICLLERTRLPVHFIFISWEITQQCAYVSSSSPPHTHTLQTSPLTPLLSHGCLAPHSECEWTKHDGHMIQIPPFSPVKPSSKSFYWQLHKDLLPELEQ